MGYMDFLVLMAPQECMVILGPMGPQGLMVALLLMIIHPSDHHSKGHLVQEGHPQVSCMVGQLITLCTLQPVYGQSKEHHTHWSESLALLKSSGPISCFYHLYFNR